MYSVEFEHEDFIITILDETAMFEDFIVTMKDSFVMLEQADIVDDIEISNTIILTYDMIQDLAAAIKSPEGFYQVQKKKI